MGVYVCVCVGGGGGGIVGWANCHIKVMEVIIAPWVKMRDLVVLRVFKSEINIIAAATVPFRI